MKKMLRLSQLAPIMILLLLGCTKDADDETISYTINVAITPSDGGVVAPSSGTYDEGTVVHIEATPSNGYSFVEWTGSVQSTANPVAITMDSDMAITGVFEKLDTDEDGVTDDLDTCPDTPNGAQVDENGCSDGQRDSDNDGLTDDLDSCPNTPSGETIDENGCSDSERDSDNDGVIDDLDMCPDTPSGENVDENGCTTLLTIYLDENGITIKCYPWGQVGFTAQVNGITYTIVDRIMLRQMVRDGEDVTKVCTSKVTDMSKLFWVTQFNQDIGSWDVSNVTDMSEMFSSFAFSKTDPVPFNQDISAWDVSKVTNMRMMFSLSLFNQDIGSWDVGNVTDMSGMFSSLTLGYMGPIGPFNQDISGWDVSKVTNMSWMFYGSFFNQDIGSWDVDNVIECSGFSTDTPLWILPKPNFTNCDPS